MRHAGFLVIPCSDVEHVRTYQANRRLPTKLPIPAMTQSGKGKTIFRPNPPSIATWKRISFGESSKASFVEPARKRESYSATGYSRAQTRRCRCPSPVHTITKLATTSPPVPDFRRTFTPQGSHSRCYCSENRLFFKKLTFVFLNYEPKNIKNRTGFHLPVITGNGKFSRFSAFPDRECEPCHTS